MTTPPFPTHIYTGTFYGTESYHRVTPGPVVATDGVLYLIQQANAFWLMDVIASHLLTNSKAKDIGFFKCHLRTTFNQTAVLTLSDAGDTEFVRQEIEYTDYPEPERVLFAELGADSKGQLMWVIMLPSEY